MRLPCIYARAISFLRVRVIFLELDSIRLIVVEL